MEEVLSVGEQRVRTTFNPGGSAVVDQIKQKSAELINMLEDLKSVEKGIGTVDLRLVAIAQTAVEEAAMWAVKAATA